MLIGGHTTSPDPRFGGMPARAWGALRRSRWRLLIALTAACLLLEEEFPFSDFPMYSSFADNTYYVYLADGSGSPLATLATAGITTPTLKKIYQSELRHETKRLRTSRQRMTPEQKRPVGERVLRRLRESRWAQQQGAAFPQVLRIYEVNISMAGTNFEKRRDLIAENS